MLYCLVTKSCPILCHPMGCSRPGFSVHRIFLARILAKNGVSFPSPQDPPHSGIKPASPAWPVASLPLSHLGNPIEQVDRCNMKTSESEVAQLCLSLCDPKNSSLPGSAVHGIFQARILEWAANMRTRSW